MDGRWLLGFGRGHHRGCAGKGGAALRSPTQRYAAGHGRLRPGGGVGGFAARARYARPVRGAGQHVRQQRLPRDAPGCGSHRGRDGAAGIGRGTTSRSRSARHGARAGLHLARDLHASARRQRLGRGVRPAQDLWRQRQRSGGVQHQGLHRPSHGRGRGGCGGSQDPGEADRSAGAQLPRARSRTGHAQSVEGRALSGALCLAAGRGLRVADCDDRAPPH